MCMRLCMLGCVMWCACVSLANAILLCLVCPKAIIKFFVCTALSLSLVIHFYKYSISLTSSRTPSFQKTISQPVTLFISVLSYDFFFFFFFLLNYHAFLVWCCIFLNIDLGKNKSMVQLIYSVVNSMCYVPLNVDAALEVYRKFSDVHRVIFGLLGHGVQFSTINIWLAKGWT